MTPAPVEESHPLRDPPQPVQRSPTLSTRREVVHEEDAGQHRRVSYDFIPPLYNPEWARMMEEENGTADPASWEVPRDRQTVHLDDPSLVFNEKS